MWYIVGLGNPGSAYSMTRHNIGWLVLDAYRKEVGLPEPVASAAYSGRVSAGVQVGEDVQLLYPDTFMNHSGSAVQKFVPKGETQQLIVVYDDIDIPFGEIKISFAKNSGGHNGLASIISSLTTKEFVRVRVGIAPRHVLTGAVIQPTAKKRAAFVLGSFGIRERLQLQSVTKHGATVLQQIVAHGYVAAMNTQGA